MINAREEEKYSDLLASSNTIVEAGRTHTLGPFPGQDVTETGRIGDRIRLKKLRLVFDYHEDSTIRSSHVRVMVAQWHPQDSATTPVALDFVTPISAYGTWGPRNEANIGQFTVLLDKHFDFSDTGRRATQQTFWVPLKYAKKQVEYKASSSTYATNKLFCIVWGNDEATVPAVSKYSIVSRLFYTDA